jgi:hypothetical protein
VREVHLHELLTFEIEVIDVSHVPVTSGKLKLIVAECEVSCTTTQFGSGG